MAVQYAFSQITTTGLKLAVDAADPLSYPGSGTTWTDVTGNGFTGTISSSILFATTNRGALVSSNSASAVVFSGSAADFGAGSFTIEMAFSPSQINGRHWLYSKNSGSFPNFGAFITGSGGSGRITAFYNVSSTVSSSATTAVGSIVTGSNYILDVTYIPSSVFTSVYLNSNLSTNSTANGTGSLSTSASLLLLNNTTSSNSGSVGNLYNFKVYNPYINSSNIRKNYNSMCSRFGLPLALYNPLGPLLDSYSGATAAYSLRRLTDFYGGSAIRVRRSSDNTEQNIGFDINGNLDTTSLLSFVGAGSGFITTWYDQSGNGHNTTNSTAANQPQIVNVGNIIVENGKPTIQFNGTSTSLTNATINITQPITRFSVAKSTNSSTVGIIIDSNSSSNRFLLAKGNASENPGLFVSSYDNTAINLSVANNNNVNLFYELGNNGSNAFSINNGTIVGGNNGLNGLNGLTIGNIRSNFFANYNLLGNIQEIIIYASNQSSNRTGIESNINSYYTIY